MTRIEVVDNEMRKLTSLMQLNNEKIKSGEDSPEIVEARKTVIMREFEVLVKIKRKIIKSGLEKTEMKGSELESTF